MRHHHLVSSILAVGIAAMSGALAHAQGDSNRLLGYLALGVGGEVTIDPELAGEFDADLDVSVGLGLRYEILLGELVSIAPMLEWLTYKIDDSFVSTDREHILDFDIFIKFRGNVEAGSTEIELYGGLPIGFSIATRDNTGGDSDALFGFNLGVMGGAIVWVGKFGLFFEVGWRGHQVWGDGDRFGANQAGINIGGMLRL